MNCEIDVWFMSLICFCLSSNLLIFQYWIFFEQRSYNVYAFLNNFLSIIQSRWLNGNSKNLIIYLNFLLIYNTVFEKIYYNDLFLIFFLIAYAIKCYQCESLTTPKCGLKFEGDDNLLLDCSRIGPPRYLQTFFPVRNATGCMKKTLESGKF